jgi:hypothetical protein
LNGEVGGMRGRTAPLVWGVAGLVLAALPIAAAWLPLVTEVTVSTAASVGATSTRHRSLVQAEGLAVLVPMAVPALVAAVPLAFRRTGRAHTLRVAAAAVLGAGCLVALASIGVFYVPAVLALVAAAVRGRPGRGVQVMGPASQPSLDR